MTSDYIINHDDLILITGSNGFIGSKVVKILLEYGFMNLRCLTRPSSNLNELNKVISSFPKAEVKVIMGNLLSKDDCQKIVKDVKIIYHLAAGRGVKSYPDAFMNSVLTTRNLLDAVLKENKLKRFVNISSFTVYSNKKIKKGGLLDETCPIEQPSHLRGSAYCFAKVKQDELVIDYGEKYKIPYVILRPGAVYGPGNPGITGRVGIDTFGIYFHMGGSNRIPLSYVDNCASAIVLAGIIKGIDGEIFNVVDDDLPRSRKFLKLYKKNVKRFKSIYIPKWLSYLLCFFWEKYSKWSNQQLPMVFSRSRWSSDWKGNKYTNDKLKRLLGWQPKVPFKEALNKYFEYQKSIRSK